MSNYMLGMLSFKHSNSMSTSMCFTAKSFALHFLTTSSRFVCNEVFDLDWIHCNVRSRMFSNMAWRKVFPFAHTMPTCNLIGPMPLNNASGVLTITGLGFFLCLLVLLPRRLNFSLPSISWDRLVSFDVRSQSRTRSVFIHLENFGSGRDPILRHNARAQSTRSTSCRLSLGLFLATVCTRFQGMKDGLSFLQRPQRSQVRSPAPCSSNFIQTSGSILTRVASSLLVPRAIRKCWANW